MKIKLKGLSAGGALAACFFLLLPAPSWAGFASLSDWVGTNNTNPANNYTVTSDSSAGGTFAERKLNESSLSDQTLVGGPFSWSSPLSMSGTLSFTGTVDPVAFLGWYNSANLNQRIGIGVANPIPVGVGIRWQTQSGNTGATGVTSQNVNSTTTNSTLPPGTYAFTFTYDGAGHMNGSIGSLVFLQRNYAQPTNQALNMNRFGFLQKSTSDDNVNTFTWNISNINYTGETQVPEPSCLAWLAISIALMNQVRRRR
jgi:hypothetical protein